MKIIGHKKNGILRGAGGYSLVELAIVVPITVIVAAGIYAVFNHAHKSSISQKVRNDLQTSCTFAMDYMRNDLTFIGYRAEKFALDPIQNAGTDTIQFEYWDDRAVFDPPYDVTRPAPNNDFLYSKGTLVEYSLDASTGELKREFRRYNKDISGYQTPTTQTLAENIQSVSFSYFTGENSPWTSGDTADIRTVAVALTCRANREDPLLDKAPELTLTAEVRARNIGVASSPTDTTPPAVPQDLIAWDEGVCGELSLRWTANTEEDLSGYTIFYGLSDGDYSGRITVSGTPGGAGGSQVATLPGLDSTKWADVDAGLPVTYYIAVRANDRSGNQSAATSPDVTGDPTPDSRTAIQGAVTPDTTINPLIPPAPENFAISAPADNQLELTWTESPVTGLTGYRLYRSEEGPDFIPDDTPGTGNLIASETTGLVAGEVSYTDTGLVGCRPYYYKLAAIGCDNTLPNDQMLYAYITGETTDGSSPPSPTLTARPGFRRIILNFINPSEETEPDFLYTKIWYNTDLTVPGNTYPSVTVNSAARTYAVSNGEILPPFENDVFINERGTFSGRGTQVVNFNNTDIVAHPNYPQTAPPILEPCSNGTFPLDEGVDCESYNFRFTAVSFDLCYNVSEVTDASIAEGQMCVDENGPPDVVTGLVANAASPPTGCYGAIQLDWDRIDPLVLEDLSGYHIWRCQGVDCDPTAASAVELTNDLPLWYNTFLDTTVLPGVVYSYAVSAADCYYEWAHTASGDTSTLGPPAYITNVSVGRIEQDSSTSQVVTGYLLPSTALLPFTVNPSEGLTPRNPTFRHDIVTLWLNNSSASNLTLSQFTGSWLDPAARLGRAPSPLMTAARSNPQT
jgi:hypothetical protein